MSTSVHTSESGLESRIRRKLYLSVLFDADPGFGQPVADILVESTPPVTPSGYTLIDEDLNKGAVGQNIYLLYSKDGTSPLVAIDAIAGDSADISVPPGFTKSPRDLNAGAGGMYIYTLSTSTNYKHTHFLSCQPIPLQTIIFFFGSNIRLDPLRRLLKPANMPPTMQNATVWAGSASL